jgi:hypothetical protein
MGGLISSFVEASGELRVNGMCVAAPYFDFHDKMLLTRLKPLVQMFEKVSPNKEFNISN